MSSYPLCYNSPKQIDNNIIDNIKFMKKVKLILILFSLLLSCGYFSSKENVVKSELCVINDNCNPNFADDYANASVGVKIGIGTAEAIIGFGIGLINPVAGLAYAL